VASPLVSPGQRLGPWVVEHAEGSHVHAKHASLPAEVVLDVQRSGTPEAERLTLDAAALARLGHEHIFARDELGVSSGVTWRVECLAGPSFFAGLKEPVTRAEAIRVMRALASARSHVRQEAPPSPHAFPLALGLGGADLVYEPGGRVGFLGVARKLAIQRLLGARVAQVGVPFTHWEIAWFAPETAKGLPSDEREDVHALGAILHGLLAHASPVDTSGSSSAIQAFAAVILKERRAPSAVVPGVDPLLDRVCERAIQREPEDRFPTIAAFLEALERGT
jgi:hypothetical protein